MFGKWPNIKTLQIFQYEDVESRDRIDIVPTM